MRHTVPVLDDLADTGLLCSEVTLRVLDGSAL